MTGQRGLIVAEGALLTVFAIAGWTRTATVPPAPAPTNVPVSPAYATQPQPPATAYAAPRAPAPRESYAPVRRVHRQRPLSHSVAIVGGSAGVGAAIGALAGGGKGAGIGAISGGAAGFVYDRLTHNR